MKTIENVTIWNNGTNKTGNILNCYAVNVVLNKNATFYYAIFTYTDNVNILELLTEGNLEMTGEAYQQWNEDIFAWDWCSEQLNLTITGDYIPPTQPINI